MPTPGYISNTELAQRISALVDRWDTRENQMIDFLAKEEGPVTVTDGLGNDHELPTFRELVDSVTNMVDELEGEAAKAADHANTALQHRQAAASHAQDAHSAQQGAEEARSDAEGAAANAAASAGLAETHADTAGSHADDADSFRAQAASHSGSAATSASEASDSAAAAAASASNAADRAIDAAQAGTVAEDARDLANLYANAPRDTEVAPGEFSAKHWAEVATQIATGALVYMGTWDASTDFPEDPEVGHLYRVTAAGDTGGIDWNPGDQALYTGDHWEKIDNTDSVTTVAGKSGDVELVAGDVGGLGNLATRDTVAWNTHITGRPSTFPAEAHTHPWGEVTGKPSTFPAESHTHPWGEVTDKPVQATRWPSTSEVSGLSSALNAKADTTHTHAVADIEFISEGVQSSDQPESYEIGITANLISSASSSGFPHFGTTLNVVANYGRAAQLLFATGGERALFRTSTSGDVNAWQGWHELWHTGNFDPDSKWDSSDATAAGLTQATSRRFSNWNDLLGGRSGFVSGTGSASNAPYGNASAGIYAAYSSAAGFVLAFSGSNDEVYARTASTSGGWNNWKRLMTDADVPRIFVQSGTPSGAKAGDLWFW